MQNAALRRVGRPRGARSNETRERIVTAARGLFGEFGYHATTFQAVAERAQLTRPAINHYFPNKQLLYQAVLGQAAAMFEHAVEQARGEPTLVAQLSSVIAAAAQLGEDDPTAAAFAVTAVVDAQRDPTLRALAGDIQGLPRAFLTEAVSDAIARGEIVTTSKIPDLAEMLLAVLWGIAFYVSLGGTQRDSAGVVASLQALLTQELWKLQQPSDDKS